MKDPKHPEALPQVNNNGTSRDELVQQRLDARAAVSAAIDALRQCIPHGRDYQTVGQPRFTTARTLHRERMAALTDLWAELEAEAYAIQNQGK
jgi:hypothetical protein